MKLYALIGRMLFPCLLPLMRPFLKRSERAYVAIIYEGKVLFVKNWLGRDRWRLPGGGIEQGEKPSDAVIRELKEELNMGLDSGALKFLHRGKYVTDNLGFTAHWFYYECTKKPFIEANKWEITSYQWSNEDCNSHSDEMTDVMSRLRDLKMVY